MRTGLTPSTLQWCRCVRLRGRNVAKSVAVRRRFRAGVGVFWQTLVMQVLRPARPGLLAAGDSVAGEETLHRLAALGVRQQRQGVYGAACEAGDAAPGHDLLRVIDLDIEDFFGSMDWGHLRSFLDQRVRDGVIRRAIGKWLNAGVMEAGELSYPQRGTPQGGVVSPFYRTSICMRCWTSGSSTK